MLDDEMPEIAPTPSDVPTGFVALTICRDDDTSITAEVPTEELVDMVEAYDDLFADTVYEDVIDGLGRAFVAALRGNQDAAGSLHAGFWAAFYAPDFGEHLRRAAADRMENGLPVHLTMHVRESGSITFVLGDYFLNYDDIDKYPDTAVSAQTFKDTIH